MPDNGFGPAIFQKFATRTSPATVGGRLKSLRAKMADAGLDGSGRLGVRQKILEVSAVCGWFRVCGRAGRRCRAVHAARGRESTSRHG